MERKKVGEVFHFFGHLGVAAIKLTDGSLAVGDTVQIQGPTTNLEQTVDSLQIEHETVANAGQGQEVGMKVRERVREKDFVYKLIATAEPAAAPKATTKKAAAKKAPPSKPRAKKRSAKKGPAKKRPTKKRTARRRAAKKPKRAKKATRATRRKARPGSRKSRRRSR